jgi:hypothetical protein
MSAATPSPRDTESRTTTSAPHRGAVPSEREDPAA